MSAIELVGPLTGWPENSIVLGSWKGKDGTKEPRLLRDYGKRHPHLLGAAPSGWGKTWQWVFPTLLGSWFGSVIVWDGKGTIGDRTAGYRSTFSRVLYLDPADPNSVRWNPLTSVRSSRSGPLGFLMTTQDASNVIDRLPYHDPTRQGETIWDSNAKDYGSAAIVWALYFGDEGDKCLAGVSRLLAYGRPFGMAMIQNEHPNPELRQWIADAATRIWTNSDRYASSVIGTFDSYLKPYREIVLSRVTSTSDFTPSDLMCREEPVSLYIRASLLNEERLAPFFRLLLGQIIGELMEHADCDRDGLAKRHDMLGIIDEPRAVGRVPLLEQTVAMSREARIRWLLLCQSPNDYRAVYGQHTSIFSNARQVYGRQNDRNVQDDISRALGNVSYKDVTHSLSRQPRHDGFGMRTSRSQNTREARRALMEPAEIGQLDPERVLILGDKKPIMGWRTHADWWLKVVRPPPAETDRLKVFDPWQGIHMQTPHPRDIQAAIIAGAATAPTKQAKTKKAPATAADKRQAELPVEPATQSARAL